VQSEIIEMAVLHQTYANDLLPTGATSLRESTPEDENKDTPSTSGASLTDNHKSMPDLIPILQASLLNLYETPCELATLKPLDLYTNAPKIAFPNNMLSLEDLDLVQGFDQHDSLPAKLHAATSKRRLL
jgi:hypothetical protein